VTNILCCYTDINPLTKQSLEQYAPGTEYVDVRNNNLGYWQAIAERWNGSDDLIVIEQDMGVTADTIPALLSCFSNWCVFGYRIYTMKLMYHYGLGCVKFSAHLQQMLPVPYIEENFSDCETCGLDACWHHLDTMLKQILRHNGYNTHVHGEIAHYHNYTGTTCATLRGKGLKLIKREGFEPMVAFENALFMIPEAMHDLSALQEELQMYG
jgi:hypothetical protein